MRVVFSGVTEDRPSPEMTASVPSALSSAPAGVCIQEFAMRIHSADRHDPAHTSHEDTM